MIKKLILGFIILFCITLAKAQCIEGDCRNGYGTAIFKKQFGVKYSGYFKNKRPHGQGKAEYPNGRVYDGDWRAGVWQGKGTLTLTDGSSLSGDWLNGKFQHRIKYNTPQYNAPNAEQVSYNSSLEEIKNRPDDNFAENTSTEQRGNLAPPLMARERREKSELWGLAIGVADYDNPTIPRLKYPDNDAWSMYSFWKSPMGGALDDAHSDILVDDEASKENVEKAMKKLFTNAKSEDVVFFFFSGHGLKGSFLPNDYDGDKVRLYHNEINKMLNECPAKYKLVIADACHSGSYIASKSVKKSIENNYFEELTKARPGTAFILSSLADEESLEVSSLKNSVFSYFVLKGLKGEANTNKDNVVTVQELFDFVYTNVRSYASNLGKVQTPVLKGDFDPNMPVSFLKGE